RRTLPRSPPSPAPASAAPAPASRRPAPSACSCRSSLRVRLLSYARVEGLLHQLEDPLLAGGAVVVLDLELVCPDRERDRKLASRHLVERVAEQGRVLRILGELAVEAGARRELDRQRVAVELRGSRLAEHGRDRDRPLRDRRDDRPHPRFLKLLELDVRRA